MDGRAVERIVSAPYPKKACALLKGLGSQPWDLQEFPAVFERALTVTVFHYLFGQRRANSCYIREQVARSRIEIHSDGIDAALNRVIERVPEQLLIHIVLILTYSQILGVYLYKFRKRIHKPSSYGYRTPDGHILIGKLLPGSLRSAVDRSSVFAHCPDLAALRETKPFDEFGALPAGSAVPQGNGFNIIFVQQRLKRYYGFNLLILRRMRKHYRMVQKLSLTPQAHYFASVSESRINSHRPFLAHRRAEQQLP